ncbi:MAG TPA: helix-turn-helix transcriptional regulator [Polyangiaceae bacterium]
MTGSRGAKDEADWQQRLDEAMQARGLSGGELARRSGFTAQYINSLRSGERGGRLPLDTARRLAHALAVTVDWLTRGEGPRERLSDVYPVAAAAPPASVAPSDRYPGRAEAIALLASIASPEVIAALRAAVPEGDVDPGREWWLAYAKELARDLRRIKEDPDFVPDSPGGKKAPKSEFSLKRARRAT